MLPIKPEKSYITSPYGWRTHPITLKQQFHRGVDFGSNNKPETIFAVENGTIVKAGTGTGNSGLRIWLKGAESKKYYFYAHLSKINVKQGDKVKVGQPIGKTGKTGGATAIHLHFEIREEISKPDTAQNLSETILNKYKFK